MNSISFQPLDLIYTFCKILFAVPTHEAAPDGIGWLKDPEDQSDWWAQTLMDCLFRAVAFYVGAEAFLPESHNDSAIRKDLIAAANPSLSVGGFRWPPMLPQYRIIDYHLLLEPSPFRSRARTESPWGSRGRHHGSLSLSWTKDSAPRRHHLTRPPLPSHMK